MNHLLRMPHPRHSRVLLGAALLSLAAGCGEGGGGGGGTGAPTALPATATATLVATDQLAVTGLQMTGEQPVSDTVSDYIFKVTVRNNGAAGAAGVTALLAGVPAGTTIVDGSVAVGLIGAGASVTPGDVIVLRMARGTPVDAAALVWQMSAEPPWAGVRQAVAPYPVNARTGVNNNTAKGKAVAADAQGNVIVVGSTTGSFADVANPEQSYGAFVARYSPSGQLLWARRILDQGNGFGVEEGAYGVAVDAAGNIYVTGENLNALPGELAAGNLDVFIAKFDTGGNRVWAHQFGSSRLDHARGIAVDANGNAVITGYSDGQLPLQPPPGGEDFFIARYDSAGNRLLLKAVDLGRSDQANGVALDAAGNIYVTGTTYQQAGEFAGHKGFAAKFNGAGDQQWLTLIGENQFPTVWSNAIAVAADGATVYLAGHSYYNFDTASQELLNPDGDAFVARLDGASGARSWIHNLSSGRLEGNRYFDDEALGVATDAAGSAAFVTGYTPAVMPGETSKGAEDLFVARYGGDGTRNWVRQLGSGLPADATPNDRAFAIAADPLGDLFVTGSTIGTFGAAPPNTDRPDWFVFKMKPADGALY
jgi:hypothetical protein